MSQNVHKIFWVIIFNLGIVVAEIIYGIIGNSFALLSDALHNMGDVLALFVTYFAIKLAAKKANFQYTFGFIKIEMMATFINAFFLFVVMFYIMYEAIVRLMENETITNPMYMIIVGLIALLANMLSAIVLTKMNVPHSHNNSQKNSSQHSHHDHNIHSAYLHMLSDALISFGAVLGGIFILSFKIYSIDSWLAIIFSLYILWHTYPLLKSSFLSLIDANVVNINQKTIDDIIKNKPHIAAYHDLHIHKPNSKYNFISFHLVFDNADLNLKEVNEITECIRKDLKNQGFHHVLIQADLDDNGTPDIIRCHLS